jgi:hypothetical protein
MGSKLAAGMAWGNVRLFGAAFARRRANFCMDSVIIPYGERWMRRLALALLLPLLLASVLACAAQSAWAASAVSEKRFQAMMQRIDPSERLEQVCEYAALTKIGRDKNSYRPDRVVIEAMSAPNVAGDRMSGSGAALRSKGKWYQFEFTCEAAPDRLKVESFTYQVRGEIPEDEWEQFGLWR